MTQDLRTVSFADGLDLGADDGGAKKHASTSAFRIRRPPPLRAKPAAA